MITFRTCLQAVALGGVMGFGSACVSTVTNNQEAMAATQLVVSGGPPEPIKPDILWNEGSRWSRIDLWGDEKVGNVHHVRVPTSWNWAGSRAESAVLLQYALMGLYQADIYRELARNRPSHIYQGGLERDFPPGTRENLMRYLQAVHPELQDHLSRSTDSMVTRVITLGIVGAGFMYKFIHDDVYLHRTVGQLDSKEPADHHKAALARGNQKSFRVLAAASDDFVADDISRLLLFNPGAEVWILDEGRGSLCDNFQMKSRQPRIVSTWFDLDVMQKVFLGVLDEAHTGFSCE